MPPQAAKLNAASFGNELVLYWGDTTYRLESSALLGSGENWLPVNNAASPFALNTADAQHFYRLRKP